MSASSFALMLYQLLLTRVLRVVLFADLAAMALSIGMLGLFAGAVAHAVRPRILSWEAVASLVATQGVSTVLSLALTLQMPLVSERTPLVTWYSRHPERFSLLHYHWYLFLLVVLVVPSALGGYVLAATVTSSGSRFGPTYASDLVGAGLASVVFVPALRIWSAPDAAFLVPAACLASAAALSSRRRAVFGLLAGVAAGALVVGSQRTLLDVRHSAGWSEHGVVWSRWTPVARLALYRSRVVQGVPGDYLLVDNASASLVVEHESQLVALREYAGRAVVYELRPGASQVAVIAAGAGPDVAMALDYGVARVDAYDLAPEIFDAVRERYPGAPRNPFASSRVRTIVADGRSGVRRSGRIYDVIQLVHGNFMSAGGLLEDAWTPQLLYTREAVGLWLEHLAPDGLLALTTHGTMGLSSTVEAALATRGLSANEHMLFLQGRHDDVLLVKATPFEAHERVRAEVWARAHDAHVGGDRGGRTPMLTDDHPYPDRPRDLLDPARPVGQLYGTLLLTVVVVSMALALALRRSPAIAPRGLLGFGAALGYGFLALEVAATSRLLSFVGHPTYTVNAVLAGAMLGGACGAAASRIVPNDHTATVARGGALLVAVLTLASAPASTLLLDLPILSFELRAWMAVALCALLFAPAGLMLPLAHRHVSAGVFPWVWAVCGWAGVLAGSTTLLLVRFFGYSAVALAGGCAYLAAWWLFPRRPRATSGSD